MGNLQHLADGILKGGLQMRYWLLQFSILVNSTIPEAKQYLAEQGIEMRLKRSITQKTTSQNHRLRGFYSLNISSGKKYLCLSKVWKIRLFNARG